MDIENVALHVPGALIPTTFFRSHSMRRTTLFPTVILSALLTSCALAQAPPGAAVPLANVNLNEARLRVHFIDIGPGMAALIETPFT